MTGHQVMEIILLLGAIKIRSMYKLLRKPILNKKVKQQLKQKLKLNLQLLKIQKLNKPCYWKEFHKTITQTSQEPSPLL
jgi:hypothetical protein